MEDFFKFIEPAINPLFIMFLRIGDVSLGTFRTIMIVQGKKYHAGFIGFIEVTLWIFAIRTIFTQLDSLWNIAGYSTGFMIGNMLGIWLEQKIGFGFIQLNIISMNASEKVAETLRKMYFGLTILPGEGMQGKVNMIVSVVQRKNQKKIIKLVQEVDPNAFISIQSAIPYRGFIHGSRK